MSSNEDYTLSELINKLSNTISGHDKPESATLQNFLDTLGEIAETAGNQERFGLQDVCLLTQEAFNDILETSNTLDQRQYELMKQWHILASNFIIDSKRSTATVLTDFFSHPELHSSITADDKTILDDMLIKEGHSFEAYFWDTIDAINSGSDIDLSDLNKKLEQLLLALDEKDLHGFLDLCLLFQENLSDIKESTQTPDQHQKELMLDWLNHAEHYLADTLDNNSISAMVDNLKQIAWPNSLGEEDANILLEMFGITIKQEDITAPSPAPTSNKLDSLLNSLRDAIEKADANNKDSLLAVANNIEEIGTITEEQGQFGFQDICLITVENLSDMLDAQSFDIEVYRNLANSWHNATSHYFSNSESAEALQTLFNCLTDPKWPNATSEDNLQILKEMMQITEQDQDELESTIVASTDQFESTIVTTNARLQEEFNDILDDVIETKDILAAPHTISIDLVQMLIDEIVMIQEETKSCIAKIQDKSIEPEIISDSLSQYALHIERFGNACQAAEMDGLYQASSVFSNNLHHFSNNETTLSEEQIHLIMDWPVRVSVYLEKPGDNINSEYLVSVIKNEALPNNLMPGVAPALVNLLKAVYVSDKDPAKEARQKEASPEDISIELPADINQELLDGLLQELPGQTEAFSAAMQNLIDGSGDIKEVQKAQRIAHTVKGAANTVGVKGIAILTHQLEDIMSTLTELNRLPSPALATSFMDAADCLEEMSEALLERGHAPAQSQAVLQEILDWANRLDAEGADCLESGDAATPETTQKTADTSAADESVEEATQEAILRVPAKLIDEVLRLLGETMIVTSQLQERIRISNAQSERLIEHQNHVQNLTSDLEVQVDVNSASYGHKQAANQNEVFDSLELEEYNELHTVTHQIVEAAVDSYELNLDISRDLHDLDELLIEKLRLHDEIQSLIMRTRMVPIKTIVPRLQRIVRQTCRTTKKQAALEIIGSDTLVDSDILSRLIDPLMHMLRNAIDHGIETREERIHLKKEPEGKLKLQFSREGTQILVSCKDDGAGLDHENILKKALSNDLIKADEKLSDNDINRLILHPGFSTRDKATQTSGRGVGMDIVHTEILAMKGSVHIESEKDNGCLIELRMPMTLMSSHAILLRHLNQILAISNHGVEKILHPGDAKIINTENATVCELDGEQLEIIELESLLNLPEDRRNNARENRPALLIRDEELNYVVPFQEIIDTRNLFVKSMGVYLNNIKGMLGATILGDGSVVPVIDLPELIRSPVSDIQSTGDMTNTNLHRALPVALVVDDSLSARRALAQVIQDAGFDVRTAKDGFEAVAIIEKKKPDIILVDMEMPRMNGMELTSHVRGSEDTRDIPVIMVTSRSTDKHRKQARAAGIDIYVTKPFSEDDLLDHVHTLLD